MSYSLLKKTWRDLWLKKYLVLTLSLVLTIACGAYIGMSSIYDDLKFARDEYYQQHHLADFSIQAKAVPSHEIQLIKKIPNVNQVEGRVRTRVTFSHLDLRSSLVAGEAFSIALNGRSNLNGLHLVSGRYPKSHSTEMVVLAQFAKAHGLHAGQSVRVVFPVGERSIKIVGIVYSPEQVIVLSPDSALFAPQEKYYGVIYLPVTTLADLAGLPNQYNDILVTTVNNAPKAVLETMNKVGSMLSEYGVIYKELAKNKPSINLLDAEIENIKITASIFPSIFLLVGALVINVLLQRMVKQQQKTIGVLKAIGYTRVQLLIHYLSYGIIIGLLGAFFGVALGVWIQGALIKLYMEYFKLPNLSFHYYPKQILIGIGVGVLAAVLGAFVSSRRAMKLTVAEAMHTHMTDVALSKRLWGTRYFQRLPIYWKMALRTILRDRWRSAISMFTIVLSLTLVYMAFNMSVSMMDMVDLSIDNVNHYDANIVLRHLVGESSMDSFNHLPGVRNFETLLSLPTTLESSHLKKEIVIEGIPSQNRLFTPLNDNGNPIHVPSQGLVLSRALSKILKVHVGEKVTMHPLLGHRKPVIVPVVGIVKTYIGLPAYANQLWLSHVLDSDLAFNRILVKLRHPGSAHNFKVAVSTLQDVTNVEYMQTFKDDIVKMLEQSMGGFIAIIIIFAATIAIASLYNNAMVSINERQKDIATFTVLGLSRWEIFRIFLVEGGVLLVFGLMLGIPAAYYLNRLIMMSFQTEFFRFPVKLYYPELLNSMFLILVFFVFSYCVVLRYIWKTRWLSLLNVRE